MSYNDVTKGSILNFLMFLLQGKCLLPVAHR